MFISGGAVEWRFAFAPNSVVVFYILVGPSFFSFFLSKGGGGVHAGGAAAGSRRGRDPTRRRRLFESKTRERVPGISRGRSSLFSKDDDERPNRDTPKTDREDQFDSSPFAPPPVVQEGECDDDDDGGKHREENARRDHEGGGYGGQSTRATHFMVYPKLRRFLKPMRS